MLTKEQEQKIRQLWELNRNQQEVPEKDYVNYLCDRFLPFTEPAQDGAAYETYLSGIVALPGYTHPDEEQLKKTRELQQKARTAQVNALLGVGLSDENRLWKQFPESANTPGFFAPQDELLLPYLGANSPERADLLNLYAGKQRRPEKPFRPAEQEQLDALTVKGVRNMVAKNRQGVRDLLTISDAQLTANYPELSRACQLAEAVMPARADLFNDPEKEDLQEFAAAGQLLKARMELIQSPVYPLLDMDLIRSLQQPYAEELEQKLDPEGELAPLRNYLQQRREYEALAAPRAAEEKKRDAEWTQIVTPKVLPNGLDENDLRNHLTLEKTYNEVRKIGFRRELSAEKKEAEAQKMSRFLKSAAPMLTPEQYEQRFGQILPGYQTITDPEEKAHRAQLHSQMIDAVTVGAVKEMDCFHRGLPEGTDRLDQQMFSMLEKDDQQKLYEYTVRYHQNALLPTDGDERKRLAVTAARNMIARRGELEAAKNYTDEEIIRTYPKMHGLMMTSAAADDYIKVAPDRFSEEEKQQLRQLNELGTYYMARVQTLLAPQYEIFKYDDMYRAPLHTLYETQNKLQELDEVSAGGISGNILFRFDHYNVDSTISKMQFAREPSSTEKVLNAVQSHLRGTGLEAKKASFCTADGKFISASDLIVALDLGKPVYAFERGKYAIPVSCKTDMSGEILTGDAALRKSAEAVQNAPAPVSPEPVPAEEDPEPEFSLGSRLWNGIVNAFTLFRRNSSAYEQYSAAWDQWAVRENARRDWADLGEDGQEEVMDEYRARCTSQAQVQVQQIPTAVFRVAGIQPADNIPLSFPEESSAKLFENGTPQALAEKAAAGRKLPMQFMQNLKTIYDNASASYTALTQKCHAEGAARIEGGQDFRNILLYSALKTQIENGTLQKDTEELLSKPSAPAMLGAILDKAAAVNFTFNRPTDKSFYLDALSNESGKNVLGKIALNAGEVVTVVTAMAGADAEPVHEANVPNAPSLSSAPAAPDKPLEQSGFAPDRK